MNLKWTIWMMNSKTNLNELDGVLFWIVVETVKLDRTMILLFC
jgi:hypothetical protein